MQRTILLALLAVSLVGSAKAQGTIEQKKDPAGEAASNDAIIKEVQAFADRIEEAKQKSDRKALERFYADDFLCKDERFGIGEVLSKTQYLDRRGSGSHGPEDQVVKLVHSKVRWIVFGNTVIRTGYSTTILRHQGRLSKGPRLFTFVYVKRDGQWQVVAEDVFDIPKGYEEHL
jgi:ketosteroid isomerase-like protein